jgi:hypothetical protein
MRYVASEEGGWVALVGLGSATQKRAARDRHAGWSSEAQSRRLALVVSNQRFSVLAWGRCRNLASQLSGRTWRRPSADCEAAYGHPVAVVETFTDPRRRLGTCSAAASLERLGQTPGYERPAGKCRHHGRSIVWWIVSRRQGAREILFSAFDHPLISTSTARRKAAMRT